MVSVDRYDPNDQAARQRKSSVEGQDRIRNPSVEGVPLLITEFGDVRPKFVTEFGEMIEFEKRP